MKRIWQVVSAGCFILFGAFAAVAAAPQSSHGGLRFGNRDHEGRRRFDGQSQSGFSGLWGDDGWGESPYRDNGVNAGYIPYFALHPPVYYSYPVARTYGWSPFPYGPDVQTPAVDNGGPAELNNPYVPRSDKTPPPPKPKTSAERSADTNEPQPLTIINPYVEQALVSAEATSR